MLFTALKVFVAGLLLLVVVYIVVSPLIDLPPTLFTGKILLAFGLMLVITGQAGTMQRLALRIVRCSCELALSSPSNTHIASLLLC